MYKMREIRHHSIMQEKSYDADQVRYALANHGFGLQLYSLRKAIIVAIDLDPLLPEIASVIFINVKNFCNTPIIQSKFLLGKKPFIWSI